MSDTNRDHRTGQPAVKRFGPMVILGLDFLLLLGMAVRTDNCMIALLESDGDECLDDGMDVEEQETEDWPKTGPEEPTTGERPWRELTRFPSASWCKRNTISAKIITENRVSEKVFFELQKKQ